MTGATFGCNVYEWPDGGGEAVAYFDHQAGSDLPDKPKRLFVRCGEAENPEQSKVNAVQRARSRVRRLARHGGFRFMWTLTFPGQGLHQRREATELLRTWMNSGRSNKRGGAAALFKGAYIAVPELHRSHGWHWHVLANRQVDVNRLRASWSAHCHRSGKFGGLVGLVRVHVKDFGLSRSAAAYASKYVGKAVGSAELKVHRYLVGEGVEAPCPVYSITLAGDAYEALWMALPPGVADLEPRLVQVKNGGPPAVWAGW